MHFIDADRDCAVEVVAYQVLQCVVSHEELRASAVADSAPIKKAAAARGRPATLQGIAGEFCGFYFVPK